jgi:signal transduction histidine kinase
VDIARNLQQISDRTLHKRLPDLGRDDEISHLVKVINELLARLDGAFDTQRRFTADASHEICTPLTILRGDTQVALLAKRTSEEYEATLKSNLEEIERLTILVSDLLTLARCDAGEQQTSKEHLSLDYLAVNVCDSLRAVAATSEVKVSCQTSGATLIYGESNALHQILLNLITNAIRYTPPGGRVKVTLGHSQDGTAFVEVADSGIGISAEALPRIFDRFYRGENARAQSVGGSGLGLAIAEALAKSQNAHIEVSSELGKGSRFKLVVPASSADAHLAQAV